MTCGNWRILVSQLKAPQNVRSQLSTAWGQGDIVHQNYFRMNKSSPIKSIYGPLVVFSTSSQLGSVHSQLISQSSCTAPPKRTRTSFWTTHLIRIPSKLSPNTLSTCYKSNHQRALPHPFCQRSSLVNVNSYKSIIPSANS